MSQIDFTRVNNDTNGNPRYVCHFRNLINEEDKKAAGDGLDFVSREYGIALRKAKKIGGRKFHNKQYGGGIAFQSYSLPELEKQILEVKG